MSTLGEEDRKMIQRNKNLVNNKREEASNEVRVQLVGFTTPSLHKVIAAKEIHLYDLIGSLYHVEKYELRRRNKIWAELDLEICFSYGMLGYGFSSQLENRSKHPGEQIAHAMFFRAEPPTSRIYDELANDVMNCKHVGHPAFIPFTTKVDIGKIASEFGEEISSHSLDKVEEPPLLMAKMRKRLHNMQEEYSKLSLRSDRLKYLQDLVRNRSMVSYEEEFEAPKTFHLKHRTHRPPTPPQPLLGKDKEAIEELVDAFKILQHAPGITPSRKLQYQGLMMHATMNDMRKDAPSKPKGRGTWKKLFGGGKVAQEPKASTSRVQDTSIELKEDDVLGDLEPSSEVRYRGRRRSSGLQQGVAALGAFMAAGAKRASAITHNILGMDEEDEHPEQEQSTLMDRLLRKNPQPYSYKVGRAPKVTVMLPTPEMSDEDESDEDPTPASGPIIGGLGLPFMT